MIHRDYLENFLRLQDVPITDPDERIRETFGRARWHRDDIDRALLILRDDDFEPLSFGPAHYILHTNTPINSQTLSSLLGIDVDVMRQYYQEKADLHKHSRRAMERDDGEPMLLLLSICVGAASAFATSLILMYIQRVGLFHDSIANFVI